MSAGSNQGRAGGILLLDKPTGITSNAALGRAKRHLGIKKAGHTGTLDPMASGLLVLCFGEATKVSGFLLDADKSYEAEAMLGITTDSEDAEGEVLREQAVPDFSAEAIESALKGFRGPIDQVPPMHSALKHQGRRLYELARRGEVVERPPRSIVIHELDCVQWHKPRLQLLVRCSKGTYIRSLVRDIGQVLGCGAHLSALRRTASGPFDIADALTLDRLEALRQENARACLRPADQALLHLPELRLDALQAQRLRQGQTLAGVENAGSGLVRVYDPDGLIAVGEADGAGHLKAKRVFNR
ncbi:MAG: tRNA pseudouridine(55) synthase TruB [Gammaproteobacteria bacterium]|jgi:tRNA pseudouridine55 synthase|nr:tRNA pseudouridine(55) synthase TruB [Gammaproteobacteria bacterium]